MVKPQRGILLNLKEYVKQPERMVILKLVRQRTWHVNQKNNKRVKEIMEAECDISATINNQDSVL